MEHSDGGANGQQLFVVSDTHRPRIHVSVPERPGKHRQAVVESFSQSVDAASGGTLMQLGVDNADGELVPGAFVSVSLALLRDSGVLRIPAAALAFDKNGLRVATVKQVTIARNFGPSIEIASGLKPDDRVIRNPPDDVADGDKVRVAEAAKAIAKTDGAGAGGAGASAH